MFKKLKRQFIIIYSISIFLLLFFSFSLIFYSTYKNIKADIHMRSNINQREAPPSNQQKINQFEKFEQFDNRFILSEDIYLSVNDTNEILDYFAPFDIDNILLEEVQEHLSDNENIITLDSNYYFITKSKDNIIKLTNITNSVTILQNLLITLIILLIAIMIFAIIIGNFFADKALKPVRDSYYKQKSFVSDASHEIKTPISVILSCLELIKSNDDESDKWLDYCINEAGRLSRLTGNLLTLSKNENNFNLNTINKINLTEEIDLLLSAYEVKLFEEGFDIKSSINDNINITFLKDDFKQLFYILIDNAIKYNNSQKKIYINLKKHDKFATLEISNSSNYLSNEELNKIFDRFYRQDNSRNKKVDGFGLGLALAYQIMNKYHLKYKAKYEDEMFVFKIKFNI